MEPRREPPRIDIGDLTEAVMVSVRRALEEPREPDAGFPSWWPNRPIIIGIVWGPVYQPEQNPPTTKT